MIGIYENFIYKYTQNVPGLASATPGTFFICHIISYPLTSFPVL